MKPSKKKLFKRQETLLEIGEVGQQKMQNTSVLIVGCGGLGSPIAVYLGASGIGKIHLVDFDVVDLTNLHRQVFYSLDDVGEPKTKILSAFIESRSPYTKVTFTNKPFSKENAFDLIDKADIVVDATDSLVIKYLLNDTCVIKNKPLVYGSLYKFDGYVSTFNVLQNDGNYSANLRDVFPKMATDIPNCEQVGTLNAIVGMIATYQVNEVLKLITGLGSPLINKLLIYNSLENTQLKINLKPSFLKDEILKLFKINTYFDITCKVQDKKLQISALELKEKLSDIDIEIIAVLPNLELPFKVHQTIPIQDFNVDRISIDNSKTYVLVCQSGFNSYKATQILKKKYPELSVLNLTGGISAY